MVDVTQTALDIITQALKDVGVLGLGQTADAIDVTDAFLRLQWMMAQWQRKRWLVYHLKDLAVSCNGNPTYSIGPGGDFNVLSRPDKLEGAFLRQISQGTQTPGGGFSAGFSPGFQVTPQNIPLSVSNSLSVDYPLQIMQSKEHYFDIALKGLVSFPSYIFLDSDYPLGTIYAYPIPQANIYEIHIAIKEILNPFTDLVTKVNIPPEYYAALHFNLAVRLFDTYSMPVKPTTVALAKDALNVIRMANSQIPNLRLPLDLIRPGIYNPYSDQIR